MNFGMIEDDQFKVFDVGGIHVDTMSFGKIVDDAYDKYIAGL